MNGLEATESKLRKVLSGAVTFRLDSEYYQKQYLADERLIAKRSEQFEKLYSLGLQVDGSAFYPALEPYYGLGDLPFIRVADVKGYIDYDNCERIPQEILPNFPTLKVIDVGDIVLTKGGSIARAGLVTKQAAASRDLIFINSSKLDEIDYTYLSLYFQTNFCNRLLIRSSSMTAQPHLTLTLVKDLDIFRVTRRYREKLVSIFKAAQQKLEQSKALYAEAQNLLLNELRLESWQPPKDLTYQYKASQTFHAGRLDSDFFHPKYEWLVNSLRTRFEVETVESWGQVLKGMSVEYTQSSNGVPIIRSGDLSDIEIEGKFLRASHGQELFLLEESDVLISSIGFGSIGKIQVFDKQGEYGTVSEVTVIRQKRVNPYYLYFFLSCPAGQMQINRYITGATGQLHLYPKDVGKILVPIIPKHLERKLENLFIKSRRLKKNAVHMIDLAKRAVEIAIEENEQAALKFIRAAY